MAAPLQHQLRPTVPLTADTVPPVVAGMAWYTPFDQPRFPREMKAYQQQTSFSRIDPAIAVAQIAGIAYHVPWEPPRFHGVFSYIQQTELYAPSPATLPPVVAGIAWHKAWEPPRFSSDLKKFLHQTEFFQGNLNIVPTPVSGIAYHVAWEPPRFKGYPSHLQQTQMAVFTKEILPPIVADMWFKPLNEPLFTKKTAHWTQQFQMSGTLIPATLPPAVAGMAWYKAFDQPNQRRFPAQQQKFLIQGVTSASLSPPYYSVYIIF